MKRIVAILVITADLVPLIQIQSGNLQNVEDNMFKANLDHLLNMQFSLLLSLVHIERKKLTQHGIGMETRH